ncbi:DUF1963 domain-containing protein [Embleya sp. NPDC005971]|uniref:DUF1963 domain-containing protein n=1 Tax=Embleya sp. NPDC005971 TaxID=3156724 RepID=UPI0033EDCF78
MTRTTPPSPVDMGTWFPEVLPYAKTATRLHPRPAAVGVRDSSVGGPVLWPTDEPWPYCAEEHLFMDEPPAGPVPLIPVLQIFASDVPTLPYPAECDVFQLLWCPLVHGPHYTTQPRLYWRSSGAICEARSEFPRPEEGLDFIREHTPVPCAIDPEPVVEYPSWDLPPDVAAAILPARERLTAETEWVYDHHLSVAPGIKLGGYPLWTQEPDWPDCRHCEQRMDHLVTIASGEYDGATGDRWLPLEEQHVTLPSASAEERHRVWAGAGLTLGDRGGVYVFVCGGCPGLPYRHRFDCS